MTATTATAIAVVSTSAIATNVTFRSVLLDISPILSAVAGIAAAFAAFFSWLTMRAQKKISKKQGEITTFNEVSGLIFSQKQHFYSTLNDLYNQERPWLESKEKNKQKWKFRKNEWEYIYNSEVRNYLNIYEHACGVYQSEALDKNLFYDVFKGDIISIYERDFGKEAGAGISVRDESHETFNNLRKTYNEFIALRDN